RHPAIPARGKQPKPVNEDNWCGVRGVCALDLRNLVISKCRLSGDGHVLLLVSRDSRSSVVRSCWLGPGSESRCDMFFRAAVTFQRVVRSSLQAVRRWNATQMVQYPDYARLITSLPTVETVLDDHAAELGHDLVAYRNHVYRVLNLCLAIAGDSRF